MQQKNEDKNGQLVTSGIFYCRVSAEINGCGSLQTLLWLDSDVLRNRQLTIPPNVSIQWKKTQQQHETVTKTDKLK